MWQCEVMDALGLQDLEITMEDKLEDMPQKDWKHLNKHVVNYIRPCLAKDQKYNKETLARKIMAEA